MTEISFRRIASRIFFSAILVLTGFFCPSPSHAQRNVVVVRPKEINDVLVNPGMGITTFQRFNGQEPNPALKWSEVGPVAKLPQAATKPDFPDTSVSYCRWYWNVLEPEPGKYNWEIVDLAIDEARAHGQKLAIRRPRRRNRVTLVRNTLDIRSIGFGYINLWQTSTSANPGNLGPSLAVPGRGHVWTFVGRNSG